MEYNVPDLKNYKIDTVKTTLKEFNEKGGRVLMGPKISMKFNDKLKGEIKKGIKYEFEIRVKTDRKDIVEDWTLELKEKEE